MTGKSRLMENTGPVKFCELHVYQDNRESLSESTLLLFSILVSFLQNRHYSKIATHIFLAAS